MPLSDIPVIYVVDDDKAVRDSLCWLLESINLNVKSYDSGEAFLADYTIYQHGCILLDIRMPGMSGLQLQQHLNNSPFVMPIVIITGHGDVPMAVQAMKNGAFDFVEKPFNDQSLLDTIQEALKQDKEFYSKRLEHDSLKARLTMLTRREREVLILITEKHPNRIIAEKLSISIKTVEAHRSNLMDKMRVDNSQQLLEILKIYKINI